MAIPTMEVEEVHSVLSVMQKNLECPICLELMKEPVTTKCDHLFCRFCILELLSKKKRGLAACPMCKNEVTKRSLKESPRFKLLVEGLLKTIQAFEMDTGFKFSSSQDCTENQPKRSASEQLDRDGGTVQSKGYRRRQKRVLEHGQHGTPRLETNLSVQHLGNLANKLSRKNKRQRRDASEPLYIEFGLDSDSEDLLEKAGSVGSCRAEESQQAETESKEIGADLKCDGKESSRLSHGQDADVPLSAKCDFSEKNLEDPGRTPAQVGRVEAVPMSLAEENLRENSRASDSQVEQCESSVNPSSLQNDAESFICHAKGASPAQKINLDKNKKLLNFDKRSKQDLDQDTKVCSSMWYSQEGEIFKRDIDDLYDKLSPLLDIQPLPELSESSMCPVSRKRVKRSLQRVNEWLSKNDEMFTSIDATSELYPVVFPSWEDASDGGSCVSDKTELLASSVESSVVHNPDILLSKPATVKAEDKVFGKTYKRERKSNPQMNMSFMTENSSTDNVAVAARSSTKSNIKQIRRKVSGLQPEDFIQKVNKTCEEEVPDKVNSCINERTPKVLENPKVDVIDSCQVDDGETADGSDFFPVHENPIQKKDDNGQCKSSRKIIEPLSNTCDQESNTAIINNTVPRKRGKSERKHLTRTVQALKLVNEEELGKVQHSLIDGRSLQILSNQTELQIDSYPSSEETSKAKVEQRRVRRSRRLQLLAEETSKKAKSSCKAEKVHTFLENEALLGFQGGNMEGLILVCTEPQENKDLTDCNGHWLDTNQKVKELDNVNKYLHSDRENLSLVNNGNEHLKAERISETLRFSPPCHSQSQGTDIQKNISPLEINTPTTEHPVRMGSNTDPTKEPGLVKIGTELSTDMRSFPDKDLEISRSKESPRAKNALQEVIPEIEDSDLDTQYLLKSFKRAKRMSFILQPSSMPDPVPENVTSGASRQLNDSPLKDDGKGDREISSSEETQIEPPEFETFSKLTSDVVAICKTANTKNCDTASPENSTKATIKHSLSNESNHVDVIKNDLNISEYKVVSPPSMGKASTKARSKKGLQKRKKLNICSILPKTVLEISSSNCKGVKNSGELSKISEQFLQRTDVSLSNDIKHSGETAKADKAEERSELLALNSQPESVLLYATASYLSPAAVNRRGSGSKISQEKNEQVLSNCCQRDVVDGAQINQITCVTSSQNSVAERFLEHTAALANSAVLISPDDSATPDGLLGFSDEMKKKASIGEANARGKCVGFRKSPQESSLRKLRSSGSSGSQRLVKRCRRQAHKLDSSEEESSEDEDLPCFQRMFRQSSSTPPRSVSQHVPLSEDSNKCPAEGLFLISSRCNAEGGKKKHLESSREAVPSVSPESVCSVNLFSSQSNGSEDVVNEAEAPKAMTFGSRHPRSQCRSKMINQVETEEVMVEQSEEVVAMEADRGQDQCMVQNLGEGFGYESETSHTGDSSGISSQSEILSTQQRDIMQNNLKKLEQEMAALEAVLGQDATQASKILGAESDLLECQTGSALGNETILDKDNTDENGAEDKLNGATTNCSKGRTLDTHTLSSATRPPSCQPWDKMTSPCIPCIAGRKGLKGSDQKRQTSSLYTSPFHGQVGMTSFKSPVVMTKRNFSLVASGLNQNESLLVQRFARKTQSVFSNQITKGTTHVIMKTDAELACERTLKFFLGIAGRKWVVSYQWIVQCFKEGRILDECDFEVRGDVINGRHHGGPRRARQAADRTLFMDFEICCSGPFTDMSTEHLEWMVELCGASVVKQPYLFTQDPSLTAVVVVQPDAAPESTDYKAIQQQYGAIIVTREWVLDSVACYERQKYDTYLVSQS